MKGGSPILILISSPRMRRREAHNVEEMFESGRLVSMDLVELNPALDKRNVQLVLGRFK